MNILKAFVALFFCATHLHPLIITKTTLTHPVTGKDVVILGDLVMPFATTTAWRTIEEKQKQALLEQNACDGSAIILVESEKCPTVIKSLRRGGISSLRNKLVQQPSKDNIINIAENNVLPALQGLICSVFFSNLMESNLALSEEEFTQKALDEASPLVPPFMLYPYSQAIKYIEESLEAILSNQNYENCINLISKNDVQTAFYLSAVIAYHSKKRLIEALNAAQAEAQPDESFLKVISKLAYHNVRFHERCRKGESVEKIADEQWESGKLYRLFWDIESQCNSLCENTLLKSYIEHVLPHPSLKALLPSLNTIEWGYSLLSLHCFFTLLNNPNATTFISPFVGSGDAEVFENLQALLLASNFTIKKDECSLPKWNFSTLLSENVHFMKETVRIFASFATENFKISTQEIEALEKNKEEAKRIETLMAEKITALEKFDYSNKEIILPSPAKEERIFCENLDVFTHPIVVT